MFSSKKKVVSPEALIRYPPIRHRQGLVSSTLGLRFVLSDRHFQGGSMKVKCVAAVSPMLWKGDRESVVQSLPIKEMREAQLLGEWTTYIQSPLRGVYFIEINLIDIIIEYRLCVVVSVTNSAERKPTVGGWLVVLLTIFAYKTK